MINIVILISLSFSFIVAQDPADSWLVYTVAHGGDRITWVNASWVVPSYPAESGLYLNLMNLIELNDSYLLRRWERTRFTNYEPF